MTEIQTQEHAAHLGSDAAEISNAMVQLMHRSTGRGPTKSHTILKDEVAVVILREMLSPPEIELVASGQSNAILEMRRAYWELMREEACRTVEQTIGRPVLTGLMGCDPESNLMVMTFVLASE